jgi:hypothetical protein
MLLLSQMSMDTESATLVRNMVILGLGMGTSLALYTIVVQNAFPVERLGIVTATLVFFRSIGGVVGVAVLGSVMTNHLASQLQSGLATLPPGVAAKLGVLAANPQALLDPTPQAALKQQLATMGPAAQQISAQISDILRGAVASAVTQVFLIGSGLLAVAFVTSFFLREIPLRATRHTLVDEVEEIGFELGADLGDELQAEIALDAEEREATAAAEGHAAG